MLRAASLVPLTITFALAFAGCERKSEDSPPASDSTAATPAAVSANIEYLGKTYDLAIPGNCGAKPDGTYLTWAFTLDANGIPKPEEPHLLAMSEAHWSIIDFYAPLDDEQVVRIYREEPNKFGFKDGVLEFDGELGAGLTERARVRIVCPN